MKSNLGPLFSSVRKFALGALVGLTTLNAQAWTKVVDCDHDQTVIDRQQVDPGQLEHQIVFRNQKTLAQLLESGAVATRRLTSLSEIVLNLKPTANGWIGEDDAYGELGVVYFVRGESSQLIFEAFQTSTQPSGQYSVIEKLGAWSIPNCQKLAPYAVDGL